MRPWASSPTRRAIDARKPKQIEALLDDIKDEIDTLHDIRSKKKRIEAARELIDYIELHHLHGY